MKRLSLQWRITLLTALLIAGTCICLNLLLYHSGAVSIDSLNGFVFEYTPESSEDPDGLAIQTVRCRNLSAGFQMKRMM